MKLKDFVNQKINSRNHQVSLDIKKLKLKEEGIDIDDLMEMNISRTKLEKFKRGGF